MCRLKAVIAVGTLVIATSAHAAPPGAEPDLATAIPPTEGANMSDWNGPSVLPLHSMFAGAPDVTVFEGFVQGKWDGFRQQFALEMALANFRPKPGAKFEGGVVTSWDQGAVTTRVWGQVEGGNPRRIKIFEPRHPGNGYYSGTLSTTGMGGSYHYYKAGRYPDYQWSVTFARRH